MVIGIAVSNGILLVDDANRRFEEGAEKFEAIIAAARSRFVPIAMTSLATVIGLIPTALGLEHGIGGQPAAGAGGRRGADVVDGPVAVPGAGDVHALREEAGGGGVIRRVLVAVDGSPRAPGVFDAAVGIASRFAASLRALRVVFLPPEFPAAAAGNPTDSLPAYLTETATEELAALAARATPERVALEEPLVRFGVPWRVIVAVSDELDVNLVVIGSHGYHGLDRVLGTTAARVANLARRNVLVVHEPFSGALSAPSARTPYRGSSE